MNKYFSVKKSLIYKNSLLKLGKINYFENELILFEYGRKLMHPNNSINE